MGRGGPERQISGFAALNSRQGTSNNEHPTSNIQGPPFGQSLDVGCSMLDVGCYLGGSGVRGIRQVHPVSAGQDVWGCGQGPAGRYHSDCQYLCSVA
jgi:hypothetical protein